MGIERRPNALKTTSRYGSSVDTHRSVEHNATMRQPFDPPEDSTAPYQPRQLAIPTQSIPATPGVRPSTGQPLSPPLTHVPAPQYLASPTAAPQYPTHQTHHPYGAFYAGHLNGATTAPSASGSSTPPFYHATGNAGHTPTGAGISFPWRGEKLATLLLILTTCVLQIIHFFFFWQIVKDGGNWLVTLVMILSYATTSPSVWWLSFSLRNLFKNQTGSSMVAMSIWFILETMTLKSGTQKIINHEIFSILTILMLLTSTAGAVLATILNKRLASSRTASVTLSLATCQFILAVSVLHLVELAWYAYVAQASGIGINQYSAGIWLTWSNSGGLGLSLTSGLLVTFFFISLSLGCLFTGMRTSHRPAFKILSIATTTLLTAYNLAIFGVYGVSTQDTYGHRPLHAGSELLAILIVGAILIGAAAAAGNRSTAAWFSRPVSVRGPYSGR